MPPRAGDAVDSLVAKTLSSRKYRGIAPETVRDVVAREVSRGGGESGAAARARLRLHRLWAGYLGEPDHEQAVRSLEDAFAAGAGAAAGDAAVRGACLAVMERHQSSRERLAELEPFYRAVFEATGRPDALLDLACAVNPLAWRWMGLDRGARYFAYDINSRTVDLVSRYLALEGVPGRAEHRDVLVRPPEEAGDVALLLKMYHCLEHRRRGAGWEAIESAPTAWVVVSFPTRNLASRRADIIGNYEPEIRAKAAARGWPVAEAGVASEVALIVRKEPPCST
jgi:16S rRNA (guanine(1405)-N(7))-methyltransferase